MTYEATFELEEEGKFYKLPCSNSLLCVNGMKSILKPLGFKRIPEHVTMEFSLERKRGDKWFKVFAGDKGIHAKCKWWQMHYYLAYELEKHGLMNRTFWVRIEDKNGGK
jgi:hypothetical protein